MSDTYNNQKEMTSKKEIYTLKYQSLFYWLSLTINFFSVSEHPTDPAL